MIDRRFLNVRITVKGLAETAPSNPNSVGDQWIVSKAWGDSYPNAQVNSIAAYENGGWKFTMPSSYSASLEVINLATNEILKWDYSNNTWKAVGSLGGLIYPFVVDNAYASNKVPENTLDKVGEVYIVSELDGDTNVYQITGAGESGRKSLGKVGLGQKVAVIKHGNVYTVKSKTVTNADSGEQSTVNYFYSDGYVPVNTLIFAQKTQNVYLSAPLTNYDLISLTTSINAAGENQGTLTIVPHTFTAEEVQDKRVNFTDVVESKNLNKVMCFIGGNVCVHGVDFTAYVNTNDGNLYINASNSNLSWYSNFPSAGEVGIFMYFKK